MDTFRGYVEHIIYAKQETGYAVFILVTPEDEEYTCVGTVHGIEEGETLKIIGEPGIHPSYGPQIKIQSFERLTPEDTVSVLRYLSSGAIKGIGPAMAGKIVNRFGDQTLHILEDEPERLTEIKGISTRIAREIARQMEEKKDLRDAMMFLQGYGISNTMAVRIYNTYGDRVREVLSENPYRLAEDVEGIGFVKADEIASQIGIRQDSDYRIACGVMHVLGEAGGEGHLFLPREELLRQSAAILNLPKEGIDALLPNLVMERKLTIKKEDGAEHVYLRTAYYTELGAASALKELYLAAERGYIGQTIPEDELRRKLADMARRQQLEVEDHQLQAVITAVHNGVMILSGGPGTGKTTTIRLMLHYFESCNMELLLAAPTGRAARRMTEATGYEARTIHRLLEITPSGTDGRGERGFHFERNEDNPLEADVVIVDEMSMVDAYLFAALLKAIAPGTRLIMVGDANQLPSVGPGQVLRDLIDSGRIPTVILDHIFRQAEQSDIVMNAHRIHRGEHLDLHAAGRDFFLMEREDYRLIYKNLVQLVTTKLPKYLNVPSDQIQVLTPMRKGNLGVGRLNEILQEYVNPPSKAKKEYAIGDRIFRVGDKVMQIKNNYQIEWEVRSRYGIAIDRGTGVFNGDIGKVTDINEYARSLQVTYDEGRIVEYPLNDLEELELAYAVTIHKAQGSEYPAVIMTLLSGPSMLMNRNLLYTGVTRAKDLVVILGTGRTVDEMIDNELPIHRNTGLCRRLSEVFS